MPEKGADTARIAAALERCADALELLATAYVQTRLVDASAVRELVDTEAELVRYAWLKPPEKTDRS